MFETSKRDVRKWKCIVFSIGILPCCGPLSSIERSVLVNFRQGFANCPKRGFIAIWESTCGWTMLLRCSKLSRIAQDLPESNASADPARDRIQLQQRRLADGFLEHVASYEARSRRKVWGQHHKQQGFEYPVFQHGSVQARGLSFAVMPQ